MYHYGFKGDQHKALGGRMQSNNDSGQYIYCSPLSSEIVQSRAGKTFSGLALIMEKMREFEAENTHCYLNTANKLFHASIVRHANTDRWMSCLISTSLSTRLVLTLTLSIMNRLEHLPSHLRLRQSIQYPSLSPCPTTLAWPAPSP